MKPRLSPAHGRYGVWIALALLGWAVTVCGARAARWVLSPATWLPDDRPVIYVGRACGGAHVISLAVLARDDLEDSVYLAPVFSLSGVGPRYDAVDQEFVDSVCVRSVPQLERRAPWLRIVPASTQCRWLAEDATVVNERIAEGGLPTVVLNGAKIPWERESAVFAGFGVLYDVSQPGVAVVRPLLADAAFDLVDKPNEPLGDIAGSSEPLQW